MPIKVEKKNKARLILVVEDEPILQKALVIELKSSGFEVSTCDNGDECLNLVKKEKPALVMLDLLITGKNGFEVLAEMGKEGLLAQSPVVVLSNLGQEHDKEKALKLGAKDYFVKSDTDLNDLVMLIKKIIK